MNRKTFLWQTLLMSAAFLLSIVSTAAGQEINLDNSEKCGDLLCYQSFKDKNIYHYLPDSPRLAYKDGRPQFSFLKYARTNETGKAGTGRAEGGGIVHFLVTYGADENRVRSAEQALREKHPEAKIQGPIVYRKGSFALITSFKEGDTGHTKTVAVGKAPLMEGQKAAVSMALTREGAEILWESFKSDTPDISLVFDMEFAGVREPYEATIEADWSRVSNHQSIKAGVKYAWFGADVDILFQELRQSEAVKITTKGKNANMDKIIQSVHSKLLKVMFDPAPVDDLTRAAAEKDSYSNLNQAVKMLKDTAVSRKKTGRRSSLFYDTNPILADCGSEDNTTDGDLFDTFSILNLFISPAHAADEPPQTQEALALFKKAETVRDEGKYSEAIQLYDQVNTLYSAVKGHKSLGAVFNTGFCYYHLENWDNAQKNFQEFLDLLPQDPSHEKERASAYAYIGSCMQALGRNDKALEYLQKAQEEPEGNNAGVLNIIADTHSNMGSYGQAAFYYKKALSNAQSGSSSYRHANRWVKEMSAKAYSHARKLDENARAVKYETEATQKALTAYTDYQDNVVPTGQRAQEVENRVQFLSAKLENAGAAQEVVPGKEDVIAGKAPATAKKSAGIKKSSSVPKTSSKRTASKKKTSPAKTTKKSKKRQQAVSSRDNGMPGFSLVASYRMKRIKRSGHLVYKLNHYRTETQAFAMSENIGSLYSSYGHDPKVFRAVNIDDPVFKQREILVTLDGQDFSTFSRHLNFVTVQMKKNHGSGETTTDEIVITPKTFTQQGNFFPLNYGWKGDNNKTEWLNYNVQTLWSFHGGVEIRTSWEVHNSAILALNPPHQYKTVTVEGDGERLSEAQVRHAVVNITSRVGGNVITTQATVRNQGPAPSLILDIPEDMKNPGSAVSITWFLAGGEKITSQPAKLEGDIIYWDELPKGGV
jgi:tetratricopeptide (TPR) repeat protein